MFKQKMKVSLFRLLILLVLLALSMGVIYVLDLTVGQHEEIILGFIAAPFIAWFTYFSILDNKDKLQKRNKN